MTHSLFEAMQRRREHAGRPLQLSESNLNFTAYGSDQPQKLRGMDVLSQLRPTIDCGRKLLWGHKPEADHYVPGPRKAICACTLGWVSPDGHGTEHNPNSQIAESMPPGSPASVHHSPRSPSTPNGRNTPTLQEDLYKFGPELRLPRQSYLRTY
ncbi:hypothetical protein SKAU_G00279790 [Synaphobranchus kaupii]|uniref:Uncharacterized protein n=1 Tax=Synaphobranchus kaupii TaxID=118154 RepID=A0A9Q1EWS3_SYNKA|nr:hypothetical protein SKAU_G00279790 [Synaphobranchus kaupii]